MTYWQKKLIVGGVIVFLAVAGFFVMQSDRTEPLVEHEEDISVNLQNQVPEIVDGDDYSEHIFSPDIEARLKLFEDTSNWNIYHSSLSGFSIYAPIPNDVYISDKTDLELGASDVFLYVFPRIERDWPEVSESNKLSVRYLSYEIGDTLKNWIEHHVIKERHGDIKDIREINIGDYRAISFQTPNDDSVSIIIEHPDDSFLLSKNVKIIVIEHPHSGFMLIEYNIPSDSRIEKAYLKILNTIKLFSIENKN